MRAAGHPRRGKGLTRIDGARIFGGSRYQGSLSGRPPGRFGRRRGFETFIKIAADGAITAYNGHVDLGTGILHRSARSSPRNSTSPLRALSSCSAIPLQCPDPSARPSRGDFIQITGAIASCSVRAAGNSLLRRRRGAAELATDELFGRGWIGPAGQDNRSISYGELIGDDAIRLELSRGRAGEMRWRCYSIVGSIICSESTACQERRTRLCPRRPRARMRALGRVDVLPPMRASIRGQPSYSGATQRLIAVDELRCKILPGLRRGRDAVGQIA